MAGVLRPVAQLEQAFGQQESVQQPAAKFGEQAVDQILTVLTTIPRGHHVLDYYMAQAHYTQVID